MRWLVALLLFASFGASAQDAAIPPLSARVTDTAGLLDPGQRSALESVLADYEAQKGTQIAVLTVSSTAPETIEQYGIRVADAWKIGRKGTADGVILIVAKDNPRDLRRLRIEVGRGLEGAITDAASKRIIDEDIAPHFRQGDFYGGLVAGTSRIKSLLEGESLPPPPERAQRRGGDASDVGPGVSLFGIVVLFIVVSMFLRGGRSRRMGYLAGNRALNRSSAGSFVTGAILGSLANRGGGGGFGGGGGGGGFSGGGGDFGGGGASGDW